MNNVLLPKTLNELWSCLADAPGACVYAGGTDLLVKLRARQEQALSLIREKPPLTHLVLTGRDAHAEVVELGDVFGISHLNRHVHPPTAASRGRTRRAARRR